MAFTRLLQYRIAGTRPELPTPHAPPCTARRCDGAEMLRIGIEKMRGLQRNREVIL